MLARSCVAGHAGANRTTYRILQIIGVFENAYIAWVNQMIAISTAARAAVIAAAFAVLPSAAEQLVSCSFSPGTSVFPDLISRGLYLNNYRGQSLRSIKLRHTASTTGAYKITLTARLNDYAGTVIGEPFTASVNLDTNVGTEVIYELGDAPVTPGSTVTFAMTATGPGAVFYDKGTVLCADVYETEDTSLPLSTIRRNGMGLEVRGRVVPETFYDCAFASGGDHVSRGIFIANYPGRTLRKVFLRYEAASAGARTLKLTARQDVYDGSIIGEPQTKILNFGVAGNGGGQIVEWDFGGAFVKQNGTITFTHEIVRGGDLTHSGTTFATCPDVVETEGTSGTLDTNRGTRGIRVTGDREVGYRRVVEYFQVGSKHYFITGRPSEQAQLDQYPALFQRTGASFLAFPSLGAPQGSLPICRFYLPPASGGPNSHFYGQPADCNAVLATGSPKFQFEGYDFAVYAPVSGNCPSYAPNKIYRSFNNRVTQNDGNHRYTTTVGNYDSMTALGWVAEGAVFCSDTVAP